MTAEPIQDNPIPYTLKRSSRARAMSITIFPDARVVVTVPLIFPKFLADRFVFKKRKWISKKVRYFQNRPKRPAKNPVDVIPLRSRKEFNAYRRPAKQLVLQKLQEWNAHYNFAYKKVSVRNQKSRWGSCSQKGNLNFSYRILFLAPELQDYLIVHELCHLKEMNHSRDFWDLVGKTIHDHKDKRKRLRAID